MDEEDGATGSSSLPDVFRRVLERLDRFAPLPPGAPFPRSLGPGSPASRIEAVGPGEPATDVIQGPHTIHVTIDLPGVNRENIVMRATETTLTVSANSSPTRKYFREIPLPAPVLIDTIRATYKNGVLDISLEKKDQTWRIPVN